jgi:hypothetical protein
MIEHLRLVMKTPMNAGIKSLDSIFIVLPAVSVIRIYLGIRIQYNPEVFQNAKIGRVREVWIFTRSGHPQMGINPLARRSDSAGTGWLNRI